MLPRHERFFNDNHRRVGQLPEVVFDKQFIGLKETSAKSTGFHACLKLISNAPVNLTKAPRSLLVTGLAFLWRTVLLYPYILKSLVILEIWSALSSVSYNGKSGRAILAWNHTCDFKSNSPCALVRFYNHAYSFRPNCTPLSSITIINHTIFSE